MSQAQQFDEQAEAEEWFDNHDEAEIAGMFEQVNYGVLLNVARSAGVDIPHGVEKDTLIDLLVDAEVFPSPGVAGNYYQNTEDGVEQVELLEVQTPDNSGSSDEPRDLTVLYCLTRAETTPSRVNEIRQALEGVGYELREAGNENDKFSIVLPAENREEPAGGDESDSSEEADADTGEEEEPEETAGDEPDARAELEEQTRDEIYERAIELDIPGRGDMTKAELIDAVVDAIDE